MKEKYFYHIAVIITVLFAACKKDGANKQQECRVSSINLNGTATTNFSYNEQGWVSVMSKGDEVTTYSYTAGGYIRQMLKANKLMEKSTTELNAQGLIQKITKQQFDLNGNVIFNLIYTYEYNGNGEIVKSISKSGSNPEQTTTYTWSNGNLVSTGSGVIYSYYTDKSSQDGDLLRITNLQAYGRILIKNKNLVKSVSQNGTTTNIDYEFDSNGRIIKSHLGNDYYAIQHVCQ